MTPARSIINTLKYFAHPFPSRKGFSAYRSPGLLVHLPVLGMFLMLAVVLCPDDAWMLPFLFVYGVIGLYAGRDVAICAHYNPLITVAVAVMAGFWFRGVSDAWSALESWRLGMQGTFIQISLATSVLIIGCFALHVRRWTVPDSEEST